jgi:hypothetical protein
MKYSSSAIRLFLFTASVAISGSNAFVAPHSKSARGIAFIPPSAGVQPSTSTSLNSATLGKVGNVAKIFKDLDDLGDYDPEDSDADSKKSEAILELTLTALEQLTDDKTAGDILEDDSISSDGVDREGYKKDAKSSLGSGITLIKGLLKYYKDYAFEETVDFATYPAHPEVS